MSEDEVCYGVLGCFSTGGAFRNLLRRPFQPLPQPPSTVKTLFSLYTRQNKAQPYRIRAWSQKTILASPFNASRPTKFLVHGYLGNKLSPWVKVSIHG